MMAEPLVELVDAGKTFPSGRVAVAGVDLALAPGEFVSLLGPSGCGKSTVLRMIAGLSAPTHGEVRRQPLLNNGSAPRLGCVFQDPTLLPWSTVWNNAYMPLRIAGVNKQNARSHVDAALALVGLADVANSYPRQLSGGMRMRASLARALVTEPQLLLLDEPLSALDEISRQALNDELRALWQAHRWTALFITHSVFEAVFLSTRVLVMSSRPGRIIADVPIDLPPDRTSDTRTTPQYIKLCRRVSSALQSAMHSSPVTPRQDSSGPLPSAGRAGEGG